MKQSDIDTLRDLLISMGLTPKAVKLFSGTQFGIIPAFPWIQPNSKTYYLFIGSIVFNGFGLNQNVTFTDFYGNPMKLDFVNTAITTTINIKFDCLYFKSVSCSNFSTFMAGTICEITVF